MLAGEETSIEIVQRWLQRRGSDDIDTVTMRVSGTVVARLCGRVQRSRACGRRGAICAQCTRGARGVQT
ncbi:unnamed protein product [Leptidea sinapis]|uniref:Uncharacterized protein n=1 Tax=Leptidea sinapis TaxID=189913 RepID=A0A5E4QFF0_9NEOP|nr:unnamed protein product [Leptidea sinapis]